MKKLLSYVTHWHRHLNGIPFVLLFLFAGNVLTAQTNVTGVVSDGNGVTIPGATVLVQGTNTATTTDVDGKYEIAAPSNAVLTFSFIGFTTQNVAVKGRTNISVTLKENTESLDEVVVIGYGSQKRTDVNGAISTIRTKDLENIKQISIDQMLQGKASGVSVTSNSGQPGSAVSIRVRGTTSISGTNEPLYIIDGVPVSGDATGRSSSGRPISGGDFSSTGGAGNNAVSPLSMINPNDIQSIDILKDASATAIYGSRGANGVIIITTKSGRRGTGKIAYEGFTSVQSVYKKLDVLNLRQFAEHQNGLANLFNLAPRPEFAQPQLLGKGTDWQSEVYRTTVTKSHQLSFAGGNEATTYYLSTGFLDNEGIILGSNYKRYSLRLNLDSKVKDWMRVGANLNTGITNENITINQSFSGLIRNTLLQAPDIPVRNVDGTYASPPDGTSVTYFNPVAEALTKDSKLVRKNFLGSVYAEASLLKGLKYRVELGANTEFSEYTEFSPSYDRGSQTNLTADLSERRQNWYSTNLKNLLTYDTQFGKHKLTLLGGQEANDSHWSGIIATASGFQTNDIYALSLSDPDNREVTDYKGSASLMSYFGRFIYDYNDKYSISGSLRQDTSSKFDPAAGKNQTGSFFGVSGSWKLSNEPFMEGTRKYIDNIKFRIGYGETGNQQIENNRYTALLAAQNSGLGQGFLPTNFPNPDLTWESLNQTNIGLDFTLLDSRLGVSLDVYRKESENFLFIVPLPLYLTGGGGQYGGISAPVSNLGVMENEGLDATITYQTKGQKNFSWNSTLVYSTYQNELVSITTSLPLFQEVNTNGYQPVIATNTVVGEAIGQFYGYLTDGIFNDQAELNAAPLQFEQTVGTAPGQTALGDIKYVDVNGDGVVNTDDRTFIGNPHPDFTFGFTNNFRYKNFDLSLFLQGSYGNDILNLTRRNGTANAALYSNQFTEALDYWTPDNTDAHLPRPINSDNNLNLLISDRYVEDGSYLRIQNVTFGYSLPQSLLEKVKMSRVRFYAGVQNLYTFTDYSGYEPEIGSFNQSVLLTGIDNGRYPSPRTFSFGLNVEF